ncbi:MAG: T9SS type A sorting domain-containing protein [Bacteroidales bacterium]|nr:T9SS type A sorting domain-containing protein [Bacteroidales bacterium]
MSCRIGLCRIVGLLLLCLHAEAQSPIENLRKYNSFRERFNREFLYRTGDASVQGSYLPMESLQMMPDGSVTAYWADGTWWLGHYVAMLATEQARLKLEGDSVAALRTLEELRQALRAYDRLDAWAEPCWGGDSCTNGFYLRDDIPAEMAEVLGVGRILSDYAQHCGDSQSLSNGPSQDQAWASFMGLALVQALTDDTLLHAQSASVARRLLKAMQYTDAKGSESWQVTKPVTGAVHQSSGDIQWLKYAHARACELLTGDKVVFGNASSAASKQLWGTIQQVFTLDKKGHYNWYGVMALSTVINEKGSDLSACTCDWLVGKSQELARLRPDLQQPMLFPHFPLISLLLYPQKPKSLPGASLYESILDTAPSGGAFRRYADGAWDTTPAPWNSLSLFCPWHLEEGDFNMLDYMLLYNLYRLVYAPEKPQPVVEYAPVRVNVFPNPTAGRLWLEFSGELQVNVCRLYDLQGRLLKQMELREKTTEIDLTEYAPGCYLLQLSDGNSRAAVVKVMKNNY